MFGPVSTQDYRLKKTEINFFFLPTQSKIIMSIQLKRAKITKNQWEPTTKNQKKKNKFQERENSEEQLAISCTVFYPFGWQDGASFQEQTQSE